jgi:hypothetical protein
VNGGCRSCFRHVVVYAAATLSCPKPAPAFRTALEGAAARRMIAAKIDEDIQLNFAFRYRQRTAVAAAALSAIALGAAAHAGKAGQSQAAAPITQTAVWSPAQDMRSSTAVKSQRLALRPGEAVRGESRSQTAKAAFSPAPAFKQAITTMFWVGERATSENGFIANVQSFWDKQWKTSFGGVDDPENRCGYKPCGFTPRENPFYVALPYGETGGDGKLKPNARAIPPSGSAASGLKNRWVEVRHGDRVCYGQWEDVGPFEADDFDYVFGTAQKPKNRYDAAAGLDVSPALWKCLGLETNTPTLWRFVASSEVPAGPWREIVTGSAGKR